MSNWVQIKGSVFLSVQGRTQHEKDYILNTVLDHLPIVSGSEKDMKPFIIRDNDPNSFKTHDEHGFITNNLTDRYGDKNYRSGWLQQSDRYILTIWASLRDRLFEESFREFQKWLCRLAKRIYIESVLVSIDGYSKIEKKYKTYIINTEPDSFGYLENSYGKMFEYPRRNKDDEPAWYEYLMWDAVKGTEYPKKLAEKYYNMEVFDSDNEESV